MSMIAGGTVSDVLEREAPDARATITVEVPVRVELTVSPGRVLRILLWIIALLAAMSVIVHALHYNFGRARLLGFADKFNMNREANVPSWYSASTILLAAGLLWLVAKAHREQRLGFVRHWRALGGVFVLLSLDEIAGFHEMMMLDLNGPKVFHYLWVAAAIPMITVLGIAYAKALMSLPARTRVLFLTAALLFVGGALGMEMISGWWASANGHHNLTYALLTTLEETMEMTGIAVLVYAILDYLAQIQNTSLRAVG